MACESRLADGGEASIGAGGILAPKMKADHFNMNFIHFPCL
ncbi:hypothetical protein ACSFV5_16475 [Acinetobacter sp. HC8-3S]